MHLNHHDESSPGAPRRNNRPNEALARVAAARAAGAYDDPFAPPPTNADGFRDTRAVVPVELAITGDAFGALERAGRLGDVLLATRIFSRMSPEQKVKSKIVLYVEGDAQETPVTRPGRFTAHTKRGHHHHLEKAPPRRRL